jgi:hypothetical protein
VVFSSTRFFGHVDTVELYRWAAFLPIVMLVWIRESDLFTMSPTTRIRIEQVFAVKCQKILAKN